MTKKYILEIKRGKRWIKMKEYNLTQVELLKLKRNLTKLKVYSRLRRID